MIRGAVFDLDGVLLDSMGIWKDLGSRYLRSLGLHPEPGLDSILFSMSMEQGAAYVKSHYSVPLREDEILTGLQKMLEDFYFNEVPAKPGAAGVLQWLSAREIPAAAATSSPREHVTRALERLGLLDKLQFILTTGELGTSKHKPDIYELAATRLGSAPAETLVFEDSLYALKTAAEAHFRTVGIFDANGEPDQQALRQTAELYLTDLRRFPEYWDALNK